MSNARDDKLAATIANAVAQAIAVTLREHQPPPPQPQSSMMAGENAARLAELGAKLTSFQESTNKAIERLEGTFKTYADESRLSLREYKAQNDAKQTEMDKRQAFHSRMIYIAMGGLAVLWAAIGVWIKLYG